jgi:hypothetical protein
MTECYKHIVCGKCGYVSSNNTGFRLHKKVAHGKDTKNTVFNDTFICGICKKAFDTRPPLLTHLRHSGHYTDRNQ